MKFLDRLASRDELAFDLSGASISGAEKKNCGRECAAG
jgi:hypothetical protein